MGRRTPEAQNDDQPKSVDIFICDDLADPKAIIKSMLNLPLQPDGKDKALRVFSENSEHLLYASTRIGTLLVTETGYETEVTTLAKDLVGKRYELTEQGSKKVVLSGKIAVKKAEATVVNLQNTGTGN